ncbi:hypothetical protein ACOMHN_051740 [Nucella lapillus]
MNDGKLVKFGTKFKFGRRKRKGKRSANPKNVTESRPVSDSLLNFVADAPSSSHSTGISEEPDASSYQTKPEPCTSKRKIESFKRKRSDSDVSDEEWAGSEEEVDDAELHLQADVTSPNLNIIINLGCLQSLVKTLGLNGLTLMRGGQ